MSMLSLCVYYDLYGYDRSLIEITLVEISEVGVGLGTQPLTSAWTGPESRWWVGERSETIYRLIQTRSLSEPVLDLLSTLWRTGWVRQSRPVMGLMAAAGEVDCTTVAASSWTIPQPVLAHSAVCRKVAGLQAVLVALKRWLNLWPVWMAPSRGRECYLLDVLVRERPAWLELASTRRSGLCSGECWPPSIRCRCFCCCWCWCYYCCCCLCPCLKGSIGVRHPCDYCKMNNKLTLALLETQNCLL